MGHKNPAEYFNRIQVAAKLGVSTSTLKQWEKARKGPRVICLSERKRLYPKADLESYLALRTTGIGGAVDE